MLSPRSLSFAVRISKLQAIHSKNLLLTKYQYLNPSFRKLSGKVKFYFIEMKDPGTKIAVEGKIGDTVLDVALDHNVDIEGACGGEMACSTCHVVLTEQLYDQLPKKSEEEQDMLDLAWGLTPTSRLCCQIKVNDLLEGQVFRVPEEKNNMM